MASFFDKPFEEQAKSIIETGDLKLLQVFIGARNPIGLLQYYSTFVITKINLMETRLNGEYKVPERCLQWYRNNMLKEDIIKQNRALLCSKLFSDVSKTVRDELFANVLLPVDNEGDTNYDSVCNADYLLSNTMSDSDQDLVSYTRNTEISRLSAVDIRQISKIYESSVENIKNFVNEIIKENFPGSSEGREKVNEELSLLKTMIVEEEGEIIKYKNSLRKIKDRSLLRDWYRELINQVKKDVRECKHHILHEYFPVDKRREDKFMEKFKKQFTSEIVSRLLRKIAGDEYTKEHVEYLKDIIMDQLVETFKLDYKSVVEGVNTTFKEDIERDYKFRETLLPVIIKLKPQEVMQAEQSVLDDLLQEAVAQGKQDSALLLICNGANINSEKEMEDESRVRIKEKLDEKVLEEPGFLVIKKLYRDMPSIKASIRMNLDIETFDEFITEKSSQIKENFQVFKIEDILSLANIRDSFPDNTAMKEAADHLVKCNEDKLALKEQVAQKAKLLEEMQSWFDKKKKQFKKASCVLALAPIADIPWYSFAYAALYLGSCYIFAAVHLLIRWRARRNARNELQVAQEDLDRAVKMFNVFLEILQHSVVAGNDIFEKMCQEVKSEIDYIKKNKEKWVNLSNVLLAFEKAQKAGSIANGENDCCFNTESIKFEKLAEDIIFNRMRYMNMLGNIGLSNISIPRLRRINEDEENKEEERNQEENKKSDSESRLRFAEARFKIAEAHKKACMNSLVRAKDEVPSASACGTLQDIQDTLKLPMHDRVAEGCVS